MKHIPSDTHLRERLDELPVSESQDTFQDTLMIVMTGGRARWRIENETFNTLKNQGYHFEHNY